MNVLFICDGNVARSQEAEVFFNVLASDHHHATSAGTNPKIGKPIDPAVVHVMSELGYGIDGCYRKPVSEDMAKAADVVVSFKPPDELPGTLAGLAALRYWDIPDPKGEPLEFHRKVRDEIQARVVNLVTELGAK